MAREGREIFLRSLSNPIYLPPTIKDLKIVTGWSEFDHY
jgi:hypothetical protein